MHDGNIAASADERNGNKRRTSGGKKSKQRKEPSDSTRFEMRIRAHKRINGTLTKLRWLLTALSHNRGYAFMSQPDLAKQVNASLRQVQYALDALEADGSFQVKKFPGVHRPRQYHRVYQDDDETPDEFVLRMQTHPTNDVLPAMHWMACDATKDNRTAEISFRGLWGVSDEALRQARHRMHEIGFFKVNSDHRRGKPASYTRDGSNVQTHDDVGKALVEAWDRLQEGKPPREQEEREEREKREWEFAFKAGLDVFGGKPIVTRSIKKRVVRPKIGSDMEA